MCEQCDVFYCDPCACAATRPGPLAKHRLVPPAQGRVSRQLSHGGLHLHRPRAGEPQHVLRAVQNAQLYSYQCLEEGTSSPEVKALGAMWKLHKVSLRKPTLTPRTSDPPFCSR